MHSQRFPALIIAILLATPAFAQTTAKPLNLQVPPSDVPAAPSTAGAPAHAAPASAGTTAVPAHPAPGVYYGDTSGRIYNTAAERQVPRCDDATYNQTQMHGSATMGVAGGRHWGGNWGGATVNISKAFGSCEAPAGGISITISGAQGNFHGH